MKSSRDLMIEEIMRRPYHSVIVCDEDGTYSAQVLEFDGCFSGGESAEEAAANIRAAMRLWIEGELAEGRDVPGPFGSQGYSGRLNLRIPASLHERASLRAAVEGTSLNQLLVSALAEYMGTTTASNRIVGLRWLEAGTPARSQIAVFGSDKGVGRVLAGALASVPSWETKSNAPGRMSARVLSPAMREV